ncbi:MOSC domain-containing protein [Jongsikchunia kroppenstedtii]|uniref:MOSC domain-containing protein n=1 Tax=Jongsikchunia kroppenstedtii TaxID=1121721 RepID=UPI00036385AB|nr:MOSC N-terminal beta barrel domain-containing protein [Jongsikchunia kroppenstedtii]
MPLEVASLHRYPVKSTRGHDLRHAELDPWGLRGDRRWMLIGADGECATARVYPSLLSVTAEFDPATATLTLNRPGIDTLVVAVPDGPPEAVTVHRKPATGVDAGTAAHAWFSALTGDPVRLMYQRRPQDRPTNPDWSLPGDRVSFADAYPLLVCTTASLDALNDLIAEGRFADEAPLDMRRFRPNAVIAGTGMHPWIEDGWRRIRLGEVTFRVTKGSARCILTTTDPDSCERGREPLATLAKHRRFDGQSWFGVNVIPEVSVDDDAALTVGDGVEILDAVDHRGGPPR